MTFNMSLTLADKFFTTSNGVEIAYYDSASKASPDQLTIVLLHGYCGSSAYFSRIVDALGMHCRVIAPDARGHGASAVTMNEVYDMEMMASDLHELLNFLHIKRAIVIGHSLGGYIALALAQTHPTYLKGFGLLHSTSLPDSATAKENRNLAIQTVKQQGARAFVEGLVPKLFAATEEKDETLINFAKGIGYMTEPQAIIGLARGMQARPDRKQVISQAAVPVLIIAGEMDAVVSDEGKFAGSNDSTMKTIIHSGHMGMLENPEQVIHAIITFAEKVNEVQED